VKNVRGKSPNHEKREHAKRPDGEARHAVYTNYTPKEHARYPEHLMSAKVERRSPLNEPRRLPQTAKASARSR